MIPTYNRADSLISTLDSVANQSISKDLYEIIVIDDGSMDGTELRIKNYELGVKKPVVRFFKIPNGGHAKARNFGIKQAKGEIIFFTDDDCVVPHDWIERLLAGYRDYPEAVGVGGWHQAYDKDAKVKYFDKYIYFIVSKRFPDMFGFETLTDSLWHNLAGNTANVSYKKKVLDEVEGFDENFSLAGAVDWDLKVNIQRRGHKLLYVPVMISHMKRLGIKSFLRRFFYQGVDRYLMVMKYPELRGNVHYDKSVKSLIGNLAVFGFDSPKFFVAHLLAEISMFAGKLYVTYHKKKPNVSDDMRKTTDNEFGNLEIVKREMGSKKTIITMVNIFRPAKSFVSKSLNGDVNNDLSVKYSVVIPTYGRVKSLISAIESVANQGISKDLYEIIVVDDGSMDNTDMQIANCKLRIEKPEIRYFKIEHGGAANARNVGIREARGEIIFFTDDDCIVPPGWMEELMDGFRRYPDAVAVGGYYAPTTGVLENNSIERYVFSTSFWGPFLPKSAFLHNEIFSNDPLVALGSFANNTANLSVKKSALRAVGGFNENMRRLHDYDLVFRILANGFGAVYLPFPVIHDRDIGVFDFMRLFFERGQNFCLFLKYNRTILDKIIPLWSEDHYRFSMLLEWLVYGDQKVYSSVRFISLKAGMAFVNYGHDDLFSPLL